MVSMVTAALNIKDNKYTLEVEFWSVHIFKQHEKTVHLQILKLNGNKVMAMHNRKITVQKNLFNTSYFVSIVYENWKGPKSAQKLLNIYALRCLWFDFIS